MLFTPAQIKQNRLNLLIPGADAPHVYVRVLRHSVASTVSLVPKPFGRVLTSSVDSCVDVKSAPSVA